MLTVAVARAGRGDRAAATRTVDAATFHPTANADRPAAGDGGR